MDHFRQRVKERYNIVLTKAQVKRINKSIQGKEMHYKAVFIKKISLRVSLWELLLDSIPVYVYYDKTRNTVITAIEYNKRM